MSNNSLVPPGSGGGMIQVVGVGASMASYIISQLTRYAAEVAVSGVEGIVIAIENTKVTIRVTRRQAQGTYMINVRQDLAIRFSRAIDSAENNTHLRQSIKQKLMQELEQDLDEIFLQLRQELQRDRF